MARVDRLVSMSFDCLQKSGNPSSPPKSGPLPKCLTAREDQWGVHAHARTNTHARIPAFKYPHWHMFCVGKPVSEVPHGRTCHGIQSHMAAAVAFAKGRLMSGEDLGRDRPPAFCIQLQRVRIRNAVGKAPRLVRHGGAFVPTWAANDGGLHLAFFVCMHAGGEVGHDSK